MPPQPSPMMPHSAPTSVHSSGSQAGVPQTFGPPAPQTCPGSQAPQLSVPSQPSLITPQSNCDGHAVSGTHESEHNEHRWVPLQPSETVPQETPSQAACCVSGVQIGQSHSMKLPQASLIVEQIAFSCSHVVGTQPGTMHWLLTQASPASQPQLCWPPQPSAIVPHELSFGQASGWHGGGASGSSPTHAPRSNSM